MGISRQRGSIRLEKLVCLIFARSRFEFTTSEKPRFQSKKSKNQRFPALDHCWTTAGPLTPISICWALYTCILYSFSRLAKCAAPMEDDVTKSRFKLLDPGCMRFAGMYPKRFDLIPTFDQFLKYTMIRLLMWSPHSLICCRPAVSCTWQCPSKQGHASVNIQKNTGKYGFLDFYDMGVGGLQM